MWALQSLCSFLFTLLATVAFSATPLGAPVTSSHVYLLRAWHRPGETTVAKHCLFRTSGQINRPLDPDDLGVMEEGWAGLGGAR